MMQDEWCIRLSYDIDMFYRNHGIGLLLTFTYDDVHLPIFAPLKQPAFNHDHVLFFLDKLNSWMQKQYGKYSYKYFWCSEFGKNTCRPHYHSLFLLNSDVDWHEFVEKCRSLWSYGFMFPKYDDKIGDYVDDYGNINRPTLRAGVSSARYVSKYITKDISFFGLDNIAFWLDKLSVINDVFGVPIPYATRKEMIKKYLPKHWQSNGIGYSQLDYVDQSTDASIRDAIDNGVFNPLTCEKSPLSQYLINKLMYHNVRSERISPTTGKFLYDRYLTSFGRYNARKVFDIRLMKKYRKLEQFMSSKHPSNERLFSKMKKMYLKGTLLNLCLYSMVFRYIDPSLLVVRYKAFEDLSKFDSAFAFKVWLENKDTKALKCHCAVFDSSVEQVCPDEYKYFKDIFYHFERFLRSYEYISFCERIEMHKKKQLEKDEVERFKRKYFSKYSTYLM